MRRPRELSFTQPGPFNEASFVALIRSRPLDEVCLAIRACQTVRGTQRVYHAERAGRNREPVLRFAARRIEELGGTEPELQKPVLIAQGVVHVR